MSLSVFEDWIDDVKDHLLNNLSTYTSAINTEKSDNITLGDMKKAITGYSDPYDSAEYPIMYVFPGPIEQEALSMGTDNVKTEVNIIIAFSSSDKRLSPALRYAAAVWNLIKADHTLGGSVNISQWNGFIPYPVDDDNIGVLNIRLEIQRELTFT